MRPSWRVQVSGFSNIGGAVVEFDPHRPYQLPFGIWYLQKTRLQLNLLTASFDTLRVGFNGTSLRVSYNVTVDSKRYASV
jgi:hypothetical protein